MSHWPPNALEISSIQEDIRALDPREREKKYQSLARFYGVSPSTVRRHIPVGGDRKKRVDAGESAVAISATAEEKIRQERKLSPGALVKEMEANGEIEEGAVSPDQARRIRDGKTAVRRHVPAQKKARLGFRAWCEAYIEIRGHAWSTNRHAYLDEIYESLETHPYVVFRKAAQVCISTAVLLNTLWRCEVDTLKSMYYLPTDEEAEDFSNDRVNVTIDDSDHLSKIVSMRGARARDNVGLRHVGRGSHYTRGMFTKKRVKSVDADMVVMDEIDEANQENRKFATDRVKHSALQHVRELSQPSIPGYGIDAVFSRSDQRYFHLCCPTCGGYTCMDHDLSDPKPVPFPEKTFLPVPDGALWAKPDQTHYRACAHCASPLDMSNGKWVPANPGARIRGYHVSALYTEICSPMYADPADEIVATLKDARTSTERKHVTISMLGLPFGGGKVEITNKTLSRAQGEHGLGGEGYYMGVDQGDILHVVVTDRHFRVVGLYITDDWDEVLGIYDRHNVRVFVGDAMPEKRLMKSIVRAIGLRGGAGYICYYQGNGVSEGEEGDVAKILADRTESLDETVRMLTEGELSLPAEEALSIDETFVFERFKEQVKNLKRRLVEDAKGVARWEYLKGVENHFGMALNYTRLGSEVEGVPPADFSVVTRSYSDTRHPHSRTPRTPDDYAATPHHDAGLSFYDDFGVGVL